MLKDKQQIDVPAGSTPGRMVFLVNPAAGGGFGAKSWSRLDRKLTHLGLDFQVAFTSAPGHATELTRRALETGTTTIVAVGGDGTIHEAVNGFFSDGRMINPKARLGIVPLGTGSDVARSLGLPKGNAALPHLLKSPRALDVGIARFADPSGVERKQYFMNVAATGLAAEVVQQVGRHHKRLGGFLAYFLGSLAALFTARAARVEVQLDGGEPTVSNVITMAAANGNFFGSGMKLAPQARLDDGLFEVMMLSPTTLPRLVYALIRIYSGTHLALPEITSMQARRVRLRSDEPISVMFDGESGPENASWVEFELLLKALLVLA